MIIKRVNFMTGYDYPELEYDRTFSKHDEYERLNYSDLIANTRDKNPFTLKKLREDRREHLSKEKGKGKLTTALRAGIPGMVIGSGAGYIKGGKYGAALGALLGAGSGYLSGRAARALRNKIRKSGGGGKFDDLYTREEDRLAMLDGKMTKKEFKDKWYKH